MYYLIEMTSAPYLYLTDKDFEKILQKVTFTQAANIAKQIAETTTNVAMMAKKSSQRLMALNQVLIRSVSTMERKVTKLIIAILPS